MKHLITLIFCAICAIGYGQFAPTGTKTNFKNGIALGSKDSTAFGANDSLAVTIDRNGRFMYRGLGAGAYWKVVQVGTDTVPDTRFVRLQQPTQFRQDGGFWISDTGRTSRLFRAAKFYGDTLQATGSGGGVISTNGGATVASWGAGGSTEFTAHGFAGYNANRSASYTDRSFTDYRFVDSSTIHNQTGVNLSAQTAKFYVTDTIKTDGKLISNTTRAVTDSALIGFFGNLIVTQNNVTAKGYAIGDFYNGAKYITLKGSASVDRTVNFLDVSGVAAVSEDTLTSRRIPFSNSSGQLKDTTGFELDSFGSLNVPSDVASTNGSFIANASGKGFYGAVLDIFDNTTGIVGSFWNSNSNGIGVGIRGGNSIEKYTLKLVGYNADSIANFNPLGAYFYKPIRAGSNSLTVGDITAASPSFSGIVYANNNLYVRGGNQLFIFNSDNSDYWQQYNIAGVYGIAHNGSTYFTLGTSGAANFTTLGTGTVYSNAGTLTNTNPSDSSLKDSIKTLAYGLNEILKLKPKTFYYNSDSAKASLKYGFIAQDVQKIMPDMVRKLNPKDPNSKLGLETDGIYVTMVKAIQELSAENDTLKLELAELKSILKQKGIL